MRKLSFIFASLLLVVTMYAQDLKAIKLSSPDKNRGSSIMKALSDRHSDREYAAKELSLQDLSDLLWAANGINRPDGKTNGSLSVEQTGYRHLCHYERGRLPVRCQGKQPATYC